MKPKLTRWRHGALHMSVTASSSTHASPTVMSTDLLAVSTVERPRGNPTKRLLVALRTDWTTTTKSYQRSTSVDQVSRVSSRRLTVQNRFAHRDLLDPRIRYPKLASLLALKHTLTDSTAHSIPPTYLETGSEPLADFIPKLAHHRFDVIVISPPATTPFDELLALEPSRLAATPGFVWLWVGSGARGDGIGLEKGRELLAAWGYRWADSKHMSFQILER